MLPIRNTDLFDARKIKLTDVAPSQTFDLDLEHREPNWRLNKMIDEKEALKQSILKRLQTERGVYEIYSPTYGMSFYDLIGKPKDYVQSEIKQRIVDNLLVDDRIKDIYQFEFLPTTDKKAIALSFVVVSIWGELHFETEIEVN